MARKRTRNRLDERAPYEEEDERHEDEEADAESEEVDEEEEDDEDDSEELDDEEERPKKKKKKSAKETKTKTRTRSAKKERLKVVWGVFSNSNTQLATYPFNQEAEARAHAERLMNEKKAIFFVQKLKVPFEEK
jgi:uncharacterized Zn finger protein